MKTHFLTNSLWPSFANDKKTYLEYPVGNVIFETAGWIGHPRFSNDGRKIAFIEHPAYYDRGYVAVDLKAKNIAGSPKICRAFKGWPGRTMKFGLRGRAKVRRG
ncbi:MAG: hypothetical protein IPK58_23495 [Acidobacteria bacterium]|nr:hypothetical protein [Acidobacteriota bacterium]